MKKEVERVLNKFRVLKLIMFEYATKTKFTDIERGIFTAIYHSYYNDKVVKNTYSSYRTFDTQDFQNFKQFL